MLTQTILIWILLTPLALNPFTPRKNAAARDMKASVLLRMKTKHDNKISMGGCSGTYIGPYTIITAAHCIQSPGSTKVWARGIDDVLGYPVHVVAWDTRRDLALLDVPFKHPYVRIGKMPKRGDWIMNIGSPMDFEFVPSEGTVGQISYRLKGFTARYLVTTAMANPGSSGGGAFNDKGELIGVNTMIIGIFGWMGITLTVNTDTVNEFLGIVYKYYNHEEFK